LFAVKAGFTLSAVIPAINSVKVNYDQISGIDLPLNKRTEIALPYLYGIGRKNVHFLLKLANVDGNKRLKDLNQDEVVRLQKAVDTLPTEGL
jgi:small subunit ribosomal protein S13